MIGSLFGPEPDGATPLSEEDYIDLIPAHVKDRESLNLAEAMNILKAQTKYFETRLTPPEILDDLFIRQLHKDMFGDVWAWAGKYRSRDLNLGIGFSEVPVAVRNLTEDARLWLQEAEIDADFVACKVHHQLVSIHPFVNGNGRLSRLVADLLIVCLSRPEFSWGSLSDYSSREVRDLYLMALRSADQGELGPVMAFARS